MTLAPDALRTVLRRRISLAGRVRRGTDGLACGGVVRLESASFGRVEVPIRTDGFYFFFDLPPGDCLATGHDERGGTIEPRTASVVRVAITERPPLLGFDLRVRDPDDVPPTAAGRAAA